MDPHQQGRRHCLSPACLETALVRDRVIALWTTCCLKESAIKRLRIAALQEKHFKRLKIKLQCWRGGSTAGNNFSEKALTAAVWCAECFLQSRIVKRSGRGEGPAQRRPAIETGLECLFRISGPDCRQLQ